MSVFAPLATVTVTLVPAYPALAAPQVTFDFDPDEVFLENISADAASTIFVSSDGRLDNYQLRKGAPLRLGARVRKLYFRSGTLGAGAIQCEVAANTFK